jgi:predicted transcriptional regulator
MPDTEFEAGPRTSTILPTEVTRLHLRQREIATIVYSSTAVTAREVARRLSVPLKNATVRCALNRLVKKGILKRILSGKVYVYVPALTKSCSKALALQRFADDFFDGSLEEAASTMNALLRSQD